MGFCTQYRYRHSMIYHQNAYSLKTSLSEVFIVGHVVPKIGITSGKGRVL